MNNGIKVHRAPTKFGAVDFELRKSGEMIVLDYHLVPGPHHVSRRRVELHLPLPRGKAVSIRINGTVKNVAPDQRVIQVE